MRGLATSPPAPSSTASVDTSSSTDTFFSNLRSSLSYNKKHKFTFRNTRLSDTLESKGKRKGLTTEEGGDSLSAVSDDTESTCTTECDDESYGYTVAPVSCSSLIGEWRCKAQLTAPEMHC